MLSARHPQAHPVLLPPLLLLLALPLGLRLCAAARGRLLLGAGLQSVAGQRVGEEFHGRGGNETPTPELPFLQR